MTETFTVAGTMSGTSLDGVDVAFLTTDGSSEITAGPTSFHPYTDSERELLSRAFVVGQKMTDRADRSGILAEAETVVTDAHLAALKPAISKFGHIDYIGFHGQTIYHDPSQKLTIQIGDAQRMADVLGVPVVHDFRANDVAYGGEGAPLAPIFHKAIVQNINAMKPALFLNIGGVSNVSYLGKENEFLAFDTGPGNALMDDYMLTCFGQRMDEGGKVAASGKADSETLKILAGHPFFGKEPPKSLDRQSFHGFALQAVRNLSPNDAMATLNAFTVLSLQLASRWCPHAPETVIVSGGGARNPVIMTGLEAIYKTKPVTATNLGWDEEYIEANAFAYLAVRVVKKMPISFPGTTRVTSPLTGGEIAYP